MAFKNKAGVEIEASLNTKKANEEYDEFKKGIEKTPLYIDIDESQLASDISTINESIDSLKRSILSISSSFNSVNKDLKKGFRGIGFESIEQSLINIENYLDNISAGFRPIKDSSNTIISSTVSGFLDLSKTIKDSLPLLTSIINDIKGLSEISGIKNARPLSSIKEDIETTGLELGKFEKNLESFVSSNKYKHVGKGNLDFFNSKSVKSTLTDLFDNPSELVGSDSANLRKVANYLAGALTSADDKVKNIKFDIDGVEKSLLDVANVIIKNDAFSDFEFSGKKQVKEYVEVVSKLKELREEERNSPDKKSFTVGFDESAISNLSEAFSSFSGKIADGSVIGIDEKQLEQIINVVNGIKDSIEDINKLLTETFEKGILSRIKSEASEVADSFNEIKINVNDSEDKLSDNESDVVEHINESVSELSKEEEAWNRVIKLVNKYASLQKIIAENSDRRIVGTGINDRTSDFIHDNDTKKNTGYKNVTQASLAREIDSYNRMLENNEKNQAEGSGRLWSDTQLDAQIDTIAAYTNALEKSIDASKLFGKKNSDLFKEVQLRIESSKVSLEAFKEATESYLVENIISELKKSGADVENIRNEKIQGILDKMLYDNTASGHKAVNPTNILDMFIEKLNISIPNAIEAQEDLRKAVKEKNNDIQNELAETEQQAVRTATAIDSVSDNNQSHPSNSFTGGNENFNASGSIKAEQQAMSEASVSERQDLSSIRDDVELLETAFRSKTNAITDEKIAMMYASESEVKSIDAIIEKLESLIGVLKKIRQNPISVNFDLPENLDDNFSNTIKELKDSLSGFNTKDLETLSNLLPALKVNKSNVDNFQRLANVFLMLKSNLNNLSEGGAAFLSSITNIVSKTEELKNLSSILKSTSAKIKEVSKATQQNENNQKSEKSKKDKDQYKKDYGFLESDSSKSSLLKKYKQLLGLQIQSTKAEKKTSEIQDEELANINEKISLAKKLVGLNISENDDNYEYIKSLKEEATEFLRIIKKIKPSSFQDVFNSEFKKTGVDNFVKQRFDSDGNPIVRSGHEYSEKYYDSLRNIKSLYEELSTKSVKTKKQFDEAKSKIAELNKEILFAKNNSKNFDFLLADEGKIRSKQNELADYLNKNTIAAKRFKEEFDEIQDAYKHLFDDGGNRIGTEIEFENINNQFDKLKLKIKELGIEGTSFFDKIKNRITDMNSKFFAMYFSWQDWIRYIRTAVKTVVDIDTAITELRKVSDATEVELNASLQVSAKTAKELGSSIKDVVNATADWSRLGYGLKDAEELARVTTLYTNVGDNIDISSASEYLISTLQGFKLEAKDAESIIDKFNEVANNFAIDTAGIGEALKRSAASFKAANTTLEESIALVTTANEVVQDPDSIGTTFKTLSARIRGAATELSDLGEEEDEFTKTTSKLRDLVKGLTGFDIMVNEDEFKSVYDIILGIAKEWDKLTDVEQASLGEALAGKRNANTLYAIMNNVERLEEVYKTASNAAGSAKREQENYQKSIQYSLKKLGATAEEELSKLVDRDWVRTLVEDGTTAVEGIGKALDSLIPILNVVTSLVGNLAGMVSGLINNLGVGTPYVAAFTFALFKFKGVDGLVDKFGAFTSKISNLFTVLKSDIGVFREVSDSIKSVKLAQLSSNKDTISLFNSLKDNDKYVKQYTESIDEASWSLKGYEKFCRNSIQTTTKLGSALKTVGNIAKSSAILVAVSAIAKLFSEISSYQEDLSENIDKATEEYNKSISSIEEYESKISSLYEKLNDENTSVKELKATRKELLDVQNKLIGQYGSEVDGINLVTSSYDEQKKILEDIVELKDSPALRKKWMQDAFGKGTGLQDLQFWANKSLFGWMNPNYDAEWDTHVYEENLQNFKNQYYFYTQSINKTTSEGLNQLLNSFSTIDASGNNLVFSGNVENIAKDIELIRSINLEDYLDSDTATAFEKNLDAVYGKVKSVIDSLKETSDTYLRYWYDEHYTETNYYDGLINSYNEYQDAIKSGDNSKISESLEEYENWISKINSEVTDPEIRNWLLSFVPNNDDYNNLSRFDGIIKTVESEYDEYLKKWNNGEFGLKASPNGTAPIDTYESFSIAGLSSDASRLVELINEGVVDSENIRENYGDWLNQLVLGLGLSIDKVDEFVQYLTDQGYIKDARLDKLFSNDNNGFSAPIEDVYSKQSYVQNLIDQTENGKEIFDAIYGNYTSEELRAWSQEQWQEAWNIYLSERNKVLDEAINKSTSPSLSEILAKKVDGSEKSYDETIDDFKSKFSSLQSYLDKFNNGSYTSEDILNLAKEFGITGDSVDELKQKIQELQGSTLGSLDQLFDQMIKDAPESAEEINKLRDALNSFVAEANGSFNFGLTGDAYKDVLKLQDGLSKITSIYSDVKDQGDFDWSSFLNNEDFKKTFGDFKKEFDNFNTVVANNPRNIKACQEAFDELATAYIYGSEALTEVDESTRQYTIDLLKQNGVKNATQVVDKAIEKNQAKKIASDIFEEKQMKKVSNAEGELLYQRWRDSVALLNEREATDEVRAAMFRLTAQETIFNNSSLDTSEKIQALAKLAAMYGVAADSASSLNAAESVAGMIKSGAPSDIVNKLAKNGDPVQSYYDDILAKIETANIGIDIGEKNPKGSGSSDSSQDYDWIEVKIKRIEEEIAKLDKVIDSAYSSFDEKIGSVESQMNLVTEEIGLQQKAYEKYMAAANAVGLDPKYVQLIQEGALKLEEIKNNDALTKKISEYQGFYDKAMAAKDAQSELNEKIKQLVDKAYDLNNDKYSRMLENQSISEQTYITEMLKVWDKYYKDQVDKAETATERKIELFNKEKEYLRNIASAASNLFDKEIEKLNDEKDAAEKVYQKQIDGLNDQIDAINLQIDGYDKQKEAIQDQIDAIQDANDELERQLALQQALYNLERAKNQRNIAVYKNNQIEYVADDKAIKDAKKDADDAEQAIVIAGLEKQIDDIDKIIDGLNLQIDILNDQIDGINDLIEASNKYYDDQIENLEKMKNIWEELLEAEQQAKEQQALREYFGADYEKLILSGDAEAIKKWMDDYASVVAQIQEQSGGVDMSFINDLLSNFQKISGQEMNFDNLLDETGKLTTSFQKMVETVEEAGIPIDGLAQSSEDKLPTVAENMDFVTESAIQATSQVESLQGAIDSLQDKTVTITVNTVGGVPGISLGVGNVSTHAKGTVGNAFATGYNGLKHDEKNALVSEYGQPELTVLPDGTTRLTTEPTMGNLPKGTVIYNEKQTKKILKGKAFSTGSGDNLTPLSESNPEKYKLLNILNGSLVPNISLITNGITNINKTMDKIADKVVSSTTHYSSASTPNITVNNPTFTCTGVTGEEVLKQIEQSFTGLFTNAYQRAMV